MKQQTAIQWQTQTMPTPQVQGSILQRQCACGQHTVAGGECAECRKKRLQRKAAGHTNPETASPIVQEVLRSPGQPLDAETRAFMEPRFGHDFSQVQVNTSAPKQIQAKLTVNQPGDKYEQEAERVEDQVMQMSNLPQLLQKGPEKDKAISIQATVPLAQSRITDSPGLVAAPPLVHEVLRSPGQPLPSGIRAFMESRFGHDFGQVRVHTGVQAGETARALSARAFTVGSDVAFASGQFAPGTTTGRRLLAHELTHTLQQRFTPAGLQRKNGADADKEQPWAPLLKKGREGLLLEISNNLDLIRTKQSKIAETWKDNVEIVEEKPAAFILELALGVVSAGLAGVIGGMVGTAIKKVIKESRIQDFVIGATGKTVGEAIGGVSNRLKGIITATDASAPKSSATYGLANSAKSGLVNYYVTAFDNMLLVDNKTRHNEFTNQVPEMSETELAIMLHTSNETFNELNRDNAPIMRQLTIGYWEMVDELYIEGEASEYSGKTREERRERMFREDPTIDETAQRPGSMLIVGPLGSIGTWMNPKFKVRAGIVTELNKETRETLVGTAIKDLPFTLSFRFWGSMVNRGFFGGGSMVKVWFVKRTDGRIAVDLDESWESDGDDLEQGREWLALHGLTGPLTPAEPLSEELTKEYVAVGARKAYEKIKGMKLPKVINTDLL